eukprot:COSAG01_NODE_9420_length_2451_cov_1.966837_1_plen_80_part_00
MAVGSGEPRHGQIVQATRAQVEKALLAPNGCLNDAPCPPFSIHGASIRRPCVAAPQVEKELLEHAVAGRQAGGSMIDDA